MGTPYANDATYSFSASITLYAQWTALPDVTVAFNSNGGTGSMAAETGNVATTLTSNTFSRVGYTFAGWSTTANGSLAYGNGATYPFTASITLYARWAALVSVTFNENGGAGTMADEIDSSPTSLTLNAFTRSGYGFSGWNTLANGTGTPYANGATYSFSVSTTLYAQWTSDNAPVITLQPTNVEAALNSSVSFSAAATGTPTPTVQWQESSNAGSTWTSIGGATSTTLTVTDALGLDGSEFQAIFTNAAGSTATADAQLIALAQTGNWSGFVDVGSDYTAVSGTWTVPTLTCNSSNEQYSAEWVGIDGELDNSVEQDGTSTDCDGTTPEYSAWWEMYGDANSDAHGGFSVPLSPASSYLVSAGDVMTGSVNYASDEWTLVLSDATANWTFSITVSQPSPAPDQSSAEWIVESPEICTSQSLSSCSQEPMSNFGSVTFTNASATANGTTTSILSFEGAALEMVDGSSVVMAVPGFLSGDGSTFTDTWLSST
jgi:uncharacterized repeat protein (TIGR02543 family)